MPLELAVWRIDSSTKKMEFTPLDFESRLQKILAKDISIANPNLMVIGREVITSFDKRIDILAINPDGNLVILELKRDKTPRDIVAQVLDYGSWVRNLNDEDIARIFSEYQKKFSADTNEKSINEAFCEHFNLKQMPDELNETHELIIVASSLDAGTERIVQYLSEEYNVEISAIFFRVFKDGDNEYLTRAWLREPGQEDISPKEKARKGDWNGEYYVSYGTNEHRDWDEAVKYGFISAGGGSWYTNTLSLLEPGARIWVNIPGTGYTGVGTVIDSVVPVDDFIVKDENGTAVPILSLNLKAANHHTLKASSEKAEHMVRTKWIKTVPEIEAIKEKGFFGNQNTVAKPRTPKWDYTIERLKKKFGIND